MQKTVSRDQIIAIGFLLGFEKITYADISILIGDYFQRFEEYAYSTEPVSSIEKYIQFCSNGIKLKDGLTLQSYLKEENTTVKKYLEKITGKHFQQYLPYFCLERLMLKKINYGSFSEESIAYSFCEMQRKELKKMEQKGYVVKVESKDGFQYQLSNLGRLQFYKIQYADELKCFKRLLEAKHYDAELFDAFLLTQDLEKIPGDILFLENFILFCSAQDKNAQKIKQYIKHR